MMLLQRSTFMHRPTPNQTRRGEIEKALRARGLSTTGGKTQLLARLEAFDAATQPPPPTSSPPLNAAATEADDAPLVESLEHTTNASNTEVPKGKTKQKKTRAASRKTIKAKTSSSSSSTETSSTGADDEQFAALLKLTKGELQAMAVEYAVAKSGTKGQLVERILVAKALLVPPTPTEKEKETTEVSAALITPQEIESKALNQGKEEEEEISPLRIQAEERLEKQGETFIQPTSNMETLPAPAPAIPVSASPLPPLSTISERRRLSPEEAAQILEDLVRQKGTAEIGLSSSSGFPLSSSSSLDARRSSGLSTEMKSFKQKVAAFKADLSMQEESAERLQIAMMKSNEASVMQTPSTTQVAQVAVLVNDIERRSTELSREEAVTSSSLAAAIYKQQEDKEKEEQATNQIIKTDAITSINLGDTLRVEERDVTRDQGALGMALAAGIIVGAELTVAAASLAGKFVQRWVQGQKKAK